MDEGRDMGDGLAAWLGDGLDGDRICGEGDSWRGELGSIDPLPVSLSPDSVRLNLSWAEWNLWSGAELNLFSAGAERCSLVCLSPKPYSQKQVFIFKFYLADLPPQYDMFKNLLFALDVGRSKPAIRYCRNSSPDHTYIYQGIRYNCSTTRYCSTTRN